MPLYALRCPECGTDSELYCHVAADLGVETRFCACGGVMGVTLSLGRGLTWFESGRPRVIWNMGPEPVTITSHEQHKRLMKERGLEWASERQTQGRGGWV